ncbi:hypothetical protein [Rhodopila globiformis]|uniref:hypothetical protein n=1 Tax=Rhodopila globiformis TaxID=1071 RepID=UPI0011B08308|nr:hypothetical protein [Rhodopila globiformis]
MSARLRHQMAQEQLAEARELAGKAEAAHAAAVADHRRLVSAGAGIDEIRSARTAAADARDQADGAAAGVRRAEAHVDRAEIDALRAGADHVACQHRTAVDRLIQAAELVDQHFAAAQAALAALRDADAAVQTAHAAAHVHNQTVAYARGTNKMLAALPPPEQPITRIGHVRLPSYVIAYRGQDLGDGGYMPDNRTTIAPSLRASFNLPPAAPGAA